MKKRGLAEQVQLILIIAVAIALVVIVAVFIRTGLISSGSSIDAEILVLNSDYTLVSASYDTTKLDVLVRKDSGGDTFPSVVVSDSANHRAVKTYVGSVQVFQTAKVSFTREEIDSAGLIDVRQVEAYASALNKAGQVVNSNKPKDIRLISYELQAAAGNVCGDGIKNSTEECDDNNLINTDGCTASCKLAKCGDNIIWSGHEECDDGNSIANDLCNACVKTYCGDNVIQKPNGNGLIEKCDGSALFSQTCASLNYVSGDLGCLTNCAFDESDCVAPPTCGDGVVNSGENCDDGGSSNGDGCSGSCQVEIGWHCTGTPSICTTQCGDGFIVAGHEVCDSNSVSCMNGAYSGTQTCNSQCNAYGSCVSGYCNDGIINGDETCDGSNFGGKSCSTQGFYGGSLSCSGCSISTSGCNNCGNGPCDDGETELTCPADCASPPVPVDCDTNPNQPKCHDNPPGADLDNQFDVVWNNGGGQIGGIET